MPKLQPPHFKFNGPVVRDLISRRHLSVTTFAAKVGVTRGYMSKLLGERQFLSIRVRRRILDSGVFDGIPETTLWREETA